MVASEGSAGGPSSVFVGRRALRKAHAGAVKEALLRPVSVPRSCLSQRRAGRALRRVGLSLKLVFTTSQAGLLARGAYPVGIAVLSAAMRLLKRCSGRRRDESTRSENHREMDEETGDRLEPRWRRFLAQRALSDLAREISPWRMRNQVADVGRRRSESDSESECVFRFRFRIRFGCRHAGSERGSELSKRAKEVKVFRGKRHSGALLLGSAARDALQLRSESESDSESDSECAFGIRI